MRGRPEPGLLREPQVREPQPELPDAPGHRGVSAAPYWQPGGRAERVLPLRNSWAQRGASVQKAAWARSASQERPALPEPRAPPEQQGERGAGLSAGRDGEPRGVQDEEPKAEPGGQVLEEEVCS